MIGSLVQVLALARAWGISPWWLITNIPTLISVYKEIMKMVHDYKEIHNAQVKESEEKK